MQPKRGYYSLIQFCPDASRLEAVNLGVVLFCPDVGFLAARTSAGNQRAAKLVRRGELNPTALNAAKRAIERRLRVDRESFESLEDLQRFVDSRSNALKLTSPRPIKVIDPPRDLDHLFDELVGGRARGESRAPKLPLLDETFGRLEAEGRATRDWTVRVPVIGRELRVPYAYRNGVWNLVKPQRFSVEDRPATDVAMRLAIEGDLLRRHGNDEGGSKELIVVVLFEDSVGNGDSRQIASRVRHLLGEYQVRSVAESELPEFVADVQREAHPATLPGSPAAVTPC